MPWAGVLKGPHPSLLSAVGPPELAAMIFCSRSDPQFKFHQIRCLFLESMRNDPTKKMDLTV